MIVICAWCHTEQGEKAPLEDKRTTHGICKLCRDRELSKIRVLDLDDNLYNILHGKDNGVWEENAGQKP